MKYASVRQLMPKIATTSTSNTTPATIPNELDVTVENAWRPIRDSPLKLRDISLNRVTGGLRIANDENRSARAFQTGTSLLNAVVSACCCVRDCTPKSF